MSAQPQQLPTGDADLDSHRRTIIRLAFGQRAAQTLAAAVRLGVARHLSGTEMSGSELAVALRTDPDATTRLLRALTALGLTAESASGHFSLTDAGRLLEPNRPDSLASFVEMFLDPTMVAAWDRLDDSVRTGRAVFDDIFGDHFFAHVSRNPDLVRLFNESMQQGTQQTAKAVPQFYDFSRFSLVADLGGGNGTLLAHVLKARPTLRGLLLDTAEGLQQADETLHQAGVADRCDVEVGDFFVDVPIGPDLFMLKSVMHDWDDERAATIMKNVRRVIPDHGRLLFVEAVLPARVDPSRPPWMYLTDLNVLVNIGGRERTRHDFERLCASTGFKVATVTPLPPPAPFSLLEGVPVAAGG